MPQSKRQTDVLNPIALIWGQLSAMILDYKNAHSSRFDSDFIQPISGNKMGSERERELRRRRKRKKKMGLIKNRLKKASASEKEVIATKIRRMTPGAEGLLVSLGLKK